MRSRGLLGYSWTDAAMGDLMTQTVLQSRIRPSQGLHDVIGDRADLLQHPSATKPTAHGQPLKVWNVIAKHRRPYRGAVTSTPRE